jgi:hypothetical protein
MTYSFDLLSDQALKAEIEDAMEFRDWDYYQALCEEECRRENNVIES